MVTRAGSIELAVQTMTSFERSLDLARWAERSGVAAFAVADHYLSGPENPYALDQLVVLGGIAAHTERIELSTLVSPVTFRHPAVMLKAAATLAEISGGRFTLGVGTGWMEEEHSLFGLPFPDTGQRFEMLTEALGYLSAAVDPDAPGFDGAVYRLEPGTTPRPSGPLRFVVGGAGASRTPTLAGTYAHEYNPFPGATPYADRIEVARSAASDAGRDPDELLVSTAFPLVVGEDEREVRERMAEVGRARDADPHEIRTRWAELGIAVGTVDEVRSRLEELADLGMGRVYFQVAFDDLDVVARSFDLIGDPED